MAIFGSFLQKAFHSISSTITKDGLSDFFNTEWFPVANALLVIVALVVIYSLYVTAKNESKAKFDQVPSQSDGGSVSDLLWVNQIARWIFLSSSDKLPLLIDSWIQDLNISLANQLNRCGILIYGLREGTLPPLIKTIKDVKMKTDSIEAQILLQTNDFGFFVTIQENQASKIVASSNYSAAVAQFQCWFTASLSRHNGSIVFRLTACERNPIFRFVMKPLTKQTLTTTQPEAVASCIELAVLETTFSANLATWCRFAEGEILSGGKDVEDEVEEEQSCFGDSDFDEESVKNLRPRVAGRSLSDGLVIDIPPQLRKMKHEFLSNSVPGSGSSTPVASGSKVKDFESSSKVLSGSLGSLSSIHRTPSGRGPAKPIRVREKRLIIKIENILTSANKENHENVKCKFALNCPKQIVETTQKDSQSTPVTFDLGSRSSQIEVSASISTKSPDEAEASGIIFIDSIDLERPSRMELKLKSGGSELGAIKLEFAVIENYNPSNSNSLKRNSISTMDESSVAQVLFSTPTGNSKPSEVKTGLPTSPSETKITMVTSTTKKGSPSHASLTNGSDQRPMTGTDDHKKGDVIFSPKSVAETALEDLSSKEKGGGIKRTKILITSVDQDALHQPASRVGDAGSISSMEEHPTGDEDDRIAFATSDSSPEKLGPAPRRNSLHSETRSSSNVVQEETSSLQNDLYLKPDAKVRRSRSLIFGKKKKKEVRKSLVVESKHESDDSASENLPGLHKKSTSMTKLFSRMSHRGADKRRKNEEKSGLKMVLENGHQHGAGDSPVGSKPKRSSSFKRLIGKKDKKS